MSSNNEESTILRIGNVSVYDPARHMARVEFPDKDNLVSNWLPVSLMNTKMNHDEYHLDIGEHVICLMTGNGIESGVIIGSIYDDTNKPPVGDNDIRCTIFKDGTKIEVDRKKHIVKITDSYGSVFTMEDNNIRIGAVGNLEIKAGNMITISGSSLNISGSGNVKIFGSRIDLN